MTSTPEGHIEKLIHKGLALASGFQGTAVGLAVLLSYWSDEVYVFLRSTGKSIELKVRQQ